MMDYEELPSGLVIVVDTASVATPPARTKPEYLDRCPSCDSDRVDLLCKTGSYKLHCGACAYESPWLHSYGLGGVAFGPLGMACDLPKRITLEQNYDAVGIDDRLYVISSSPDPCWQISAERLGCSVDPYDRAGSIVRAWVRAAKILRVTPEDIRIARYLKPRRE